MKIIHSQASNEKINAPNSMFFASTINLARLFYLLCNY